MYSGYSIKDLRYSKGMIDWTRFKPEKGTLLLSEPTLPDGNFSRTVVLLVAHDEEGSLGFVLNRPLQLKLADLGEDFSFGDFPLYEGGPVQLETLHYIHRLGQGISGAVEIAEGIYWGGDFEQIRETVSVHDSASKDLRFFLGYSGWSGGQLQQEMTDRTWIVAPALEEEVFETESSGLWEKSLKAMGGEIARLVDYPMDPRWN